LDRSDVSRRVHKACHCERSGQSQGLTIRVQRNLLRVGRNYSLPVLPNAALVVAGSMTAKAAGGADGNGDFDHGERRARIADEEAPQ
jgi:hypothetical protein